MHQRRRHCFLSELCRRPPLRDFRGKTKAGESVRCLLSLPRRLIIDSSLLLIVSSLLRRGRCGTTTTRRSMGNMSRSAVLLSVDGRR